MLKIITRPMKFSMISRKSILPMVQHNLKSSSNTVASSTETSANKLTVWNVYGTPLTNIFLWGSITYMGLQVLWWKLEFAELIEETDNKIASLEKEIEILKKSKSY
ncbi:9598_t:CDS:1 [Racocetra persica]|uniref:9598_t:CDS:1 n=1 Tax=Racocetra persica TaxID=160502 RepID=A0ACA9MIL9_9GLOM|nr:9598_t:CDS:1 [Racocetra persica]